MDNRLTQAADSQHSTQCDSISAENPPAAPTHRTLLCSCCAASLGKVDTDWR